MDMSIIMNINDDGVPVGHSIVTDLCMNVDGDLQFTFVRSYFDESERSHALCEGWLEGYSAKEREIKGRVGHTATSVGISQ